MGFLNDGKGFQKFVSYRKILFSQREKRRGKVVRSKRTDKRTDKRMLARCSPLDDLWPLCILVDLLCILVLLDNRFLRVSLELKHTTVGF